MTFHLWVPDYTSAKGGISTFSHFLVRALHDSSPDARITILSKNDAGTANANGAISRLVVAGRWPRAFRTAVFALKLVYYCVRDRPDLILSVHLNFAPVASVLWRIFKVRCVVIAHGVEAWEIPSRRLKKALRNVRLVSVSQFTRQRVADELDVPPAAIDVLPNTFDAERFTPGPKPEFLLQRYQLQRNQPVILTVARMASNEQYKGYDQVLRALPAVLTHFPNARYVICGDGPDRARIKSLARELHLEQSIIFTGFVTDDHLCDHYRLCDVFAMPSKGEGFGIVFLEAIACGKPVIAGNMDGSVDALLGGTLGVLVDPENIEDIAEALIKVLKKEHSLAILKEPHVLRREGIEAYGYDRFLERLKPILRKVMPSNLIAKTGQRRG